MYIWMTGLGIWSEYSLWWTDEDSISRRVADEPSTETCSLSGCVSRNRSWKCHSRGSCRVCQRKSIHKKHKVNWYNGSLFDWLKYLNNQLVLYYQYYRFSLDFGIAENLYSAISGKLSMMLGWEI